METEYEVQAFLMRAGSIWGCYGRFSDMPRSKVTQEETWDFHMDGKHGEHCQ